MAATRFRSSIIFVLTIIIAFLFVSGIYTAINLKKLTASQPIPESLPEIDLYKIIFPGCTDCFSIDLAERFVKETSNAKIITTKTLTSTDSEAQQLITKYTLKRLPAIILTGEIKRVTLKSFEQREDALVFDATPPPYFDVATGKIKGKTTATIVIDASCKECFDLKPLLTQLRSAGVALTDKTIDQYSTEGQNLIQRYRLEKLPALILSKDALEYALITSVWDKVGTKESDGTLVLRTINPPFKDIATESIVQAPTLTYLTDSSCTACYDATLHKQLLAENFGMTFADERTVDVASKEGTRLLSKYTIRFVPTVIVSKEANEYNGLAIVWQQVGDVATDGSFIFRKLELLQGKTYKDLKNRQTIKAP